MRASEEMFLPEQSKQKCFKGPAFNQESDLLSEWISEMSMTLSLEDDFHSGLHKNFTFQDD